MIYSCLTPLAKMWGRPRRRKMARRLLTTWVGRERWKLILGLVAIVAWMAKLMNEFVERRNSGKGPSLLCGASEGNCRRKRKMYPQQICEWKETLQHRICVNNTCLKIFKIFNPVRFLELSLCQKQKDRIERGVNIFYWGARIWFENLSILYPWSKPSGCSLSSLDIFNERFLNCPLYNDEFFFVQNFSRPIINFAFQIYWNAYNYFSKLLNGPFPSSQNSQFQNEATCKTLLVKMSFICMRIIVIFMSITSNFASLWNRGLGLINNLSTLENCQRNVARTKKPISTRRSEIWGGFKQRPCPVIG